MVLKKAQDSAPRAADAARYARARKNATETYVKGAGRRGPRLFYKKYFKDVSREFDEFQVYSLLIFASCYFGANIELIMMPRRACAELIALRCAVCLFMSRSNRQYVCYLRGREGGMGTERGRSTEESKKTNTQRVHKPGTCIIPGTTTAICSKERTAPHNTAPQNEGQGTARHCVALCC